jgi:hypothetical protein
MHVRVTNAILIDRRGAKSRPLRPIRLGRASGTPTSETSGGPQPVAVGSRLAFVTAFLGREADYIYEVTEHVPGERFAMTRAEGPFPMETVYSWEDTHAGGTRMTL